MAKKKRTIIPSKFEDYLSLVSVTSFIALFFEFALNQPFLSDNIMPLFLIISGFGLMAIGKIFTIGEWLSDGLQENEVLRLFSITFGVASFIIGILILANIEISQGVRGFTGFLALFPIALIIADYIVRNTNIK